MAKRDGAPHAAAAGLLPSVLTMRQPRIEPAVTSAGPSARHMESLHGAAQQALVELDPRELAAVFARSCAQAAAGARALVCFQSPDGLKPSASWPPESLQELWTQNESTVRQALRRRRADIHVAADADADESVRRAATQLVAPLTDPQRQAVGVVLIAYPMHPGGFQEADLRAVETLALMCSTALARARLFDRLQEWSRSFETMLAFNAAVNRHLPPDQLVRRLVELATTFLQAEGGMAGFTVTGSNGETRMATEGYFLGNEWQSFTRQWARNEGAPGYVLEAEFVYLSNNYAEDAASDPDLLRFGAHKVLCVPIRDSQQRVLGFFSLHRGESAHPFSWQDAAFLETLGNSTAVAVENVRLLHALEQKNNDVRSLSERHVERLETERRHIARELHDETGQVLIGIKLGLQVLTMSVPQENMELRIELDRLSELVAQSSVQLRDLARNLRPPTLDNLGVDVAIEQLAREHQLRTGVQISVRSDALPYPLPEPVRTTLYRIAQEALTNIAKHAEATRAHIGLLCAGQSLQLTIQDDGLGFDTSRPGAGLGLLGMKERAEMLGGTLSITSTWGEGTTICLNIPR